jgi:glutamine synthetase
VDQTVYAQSTAAQASHAVISEMLRSLWDQGVPVEQYNAESGAGQHEITLEHGPPLLMADRLIRARETIRTVAHEHGLIASFLPLIFEGGAGSGLHTHMSLWRDGRNLMTGTKDEAWGLSAEGNAFMAGILHRLPALMAVTTPTRNSFRRIRPHSWSGAYQAWGIANKEAALRTIADSRSGMPTNFELKTVDATANPYLALGAIIAAGMHGLETADRLPDPIPIDPGDYSDEERAELGIVPLPASLEEALAQFTADPVLAAALGRLGEVFTAVRRAELATLADQTFEQERALLLERY